MVQDLKHGTTAQQITKILLKHMGKKEALKLMRELYCRIPNQALIVIFKRVVEHLLEEE